MARFRRLANDYKRLNTTVAGLHFMAFACLMLTGQLTLFLEPHATGSSALRIQEYGYPQDGKSLLHGAWAAADRALPTMARTVSKLRARTRRYLALTLLHGFLIEGRFGLYAG